ncbi:MAG: sensor histidine kinase, partial [Oscillochloridaceae bacterium umkhey_bin13]
MADTDPHPNAAVLYALALRLSPLLEPSRVTQACLEGCADLINSPHALLLSDDLPPAALGMPIPEPESIRALLEQPAVQAVKQLLGISVLPSTNALIPGKLLFAASLPSSVAAPALLLFTRATPLERSSRQTLSAALPLISQTLDRARHYQQSQHGLVSRNDAVARLAHDIRSPLVATHASIEVVQRLLRGYTVPATVSEALSMGLRSVQNAVELCTDLLELSRLQHGLPLTMQPVALERLINDTCQMLQPLAQQRSLRLSAEIPTGTLTLTGDERLLGRALINLINNGLRFAPPYGLVHVAVAPYTTSGGYLISVRDNGPGIKPADRERIFQPFMQGAGEAGYGQGLGLALCAEVAQAHGGKIWVEDAPEGGARFLLWLPDSHLNHGIGRFMRLSANYRLIAPLAAVPAWRKTVPRHDAARHEGGLGSRWLLREERARFARGNWRCE